ncbi:MAG: hypothetical protein H7222_04185 [Methylotenera sp.]|nr:hypothetical protein [Oligoflexia bacterium]
MNPRNRSAHPDSLANRDHELDPELSEALEHTALRLTQTAQTGLNEAEIYKRGQSFFIVSPAEDHRTLKVKRIV